MKKSCSPGAVKKHREQKSTVHKPDHMDNSFDYSNKPNCTCKWTGMNLNVTKSHTGQYITPFIIVGNKSRFNRAIISALFSPEPGNQGNKHFTLKFLK
jgi:hypothetical protein